MLSASNPSADLSRPNGDGTFSARGAPGGTALHAPRPWPTAPSAARELLDATSHEARMDTVGNSLVKSGTPIDTVRAAIGDPTFEPDTRTPEQVAHDDLHGVQDLVDPNQFRYARPPSDYDEGQFANFDTAARNLVADTGFEQAAGSNFIKTTLGAIHEMNANPAVLDTWQAQLTQLYGAERINAASDQIMAMLNQVAGGNALVDEFKKTGLLRNPKLFTQLMHRAAAFHAWRDGRPK